MGNNHKNQNDQKVFADNAAPFNTIKFISAEFDCVKKHIVDIAAQTVSKESRLSAQSTKSVTIVKKQKCFISQIAMSNDAHTLFVADGEGDIMQFQKEDSSLNYYPVRAFNGYYRISSISLSNSKMHLLSASWDGILRVWDLENGTQLACLNQEGKQHAKLITISIWCCCWNDQDTLFASGDRRGDVVVWSPPLSIYNTSNNFIPLIKFKVQGDNSTIRYLKFQESGLDLFALYIKSKLIRLWSISEKELLDSKSTQPQNITLPLIQQPKLQSEQMNEGIWQFDVRGSMLVVAVNEEIAQLSADSLQSTAAAMKFEKVHNSYISSLVFSKDGKYYLFTSITYVASAGSEDKSVAIFDSKSGKCVKHIEDAHSKYIFAIVFEI